MSGGHGLETQPVDREKRNSKIRLTLHNRLPSTGLKDLLLNQESIFFDIFY